MKQIACKLCGSSFMCDNGRWFTTCTCAKDRPAELKAAQEKFDKECPSTPTPVFGLQFRQEAYLIEGAGVAWCGKSLHDFRPNFAEAVRFARQPDADRVLHWILPEEYRRVCRTTLHVWIPVGESGE